MPEPRAAGTHQARKASHPRGPVDVPRLAAFEVLKEVRVNGAYANLVLPVVIRHFQLDRRDAAFVTELAAGTLRRRGTYDAIIAACADRKLGKIEAKVLDALRLGCHQLLAMRVPDHAAISTTVDLVHHKGSSGAASFANAVLRRVAEQDLSGWVVRVAPDPQVSPGGFAEIAYSHPRWVVDELRKAVGQRDLFDLLAADNEPPRVTLVARPGRSLREELPGEPTPYSPYGTVLEGGDPGEVSAVAEGRAGVQDEGSQLVAHLLAEAPIEGTDELWVDLCAGPGGKSALLAGLAGERGALVLATERTHHRTRLVQRTLAGSAGVAGIVTADGTRPPLRPGSADRVLVDAPCSGLGALRRRPEARWRRKPEDLVPLVLLQRNLVNAGLDLLRPGGVLLYATCSPVAAETNDVVSGVLRRGDVELVDAGSVLDGVPDAVGTIPGTMQLWPHRHGTDAMFMALLRKS